jgi:hypothetical protein
MTNLLHRVWRYLLYGSEELILPKSWLANRDRLRAYEGYTRRQHQQGSIVAGVAEMRRRAFWQAMEAKQQRKTLRMIHDHR